jgi:hypothetical protein
VPYVLLVTLILEGFAAFICVFTMPPLALLMVFVGLITLGVAVVVKLVLGLLEAGVSRMCRTTTEEG